MTTSRWTGERAMAVAVAVLALVFAQPLARLTLHALEHDLHSHVLLVPFIAGYLLYQRRHALPSFHRPSPGGAALLGGAGAAALAAAFSWRGALSVNDHLALTTLAFVCLVAAGGFLCLGSLWMAAAAFPLGFLIFMVPLPDGAVAWMEDASMRASAVAAGGYFHLVGTPFVRQGTVIELPGIVLEVTEACSGIRSSWVLFITSVLASDLFLTTWWRRVVLVLFVIPLGIVRNGFRILVIGLLCVHIGPHMIDSFVHRRGGPLFFVLSLIPLFLLLQGLRRGEHHRQAQRRNSGVVRMPGPVETTDRWRLTTREGSGHQRG